ncbi:MAG TPA: hypothetical protein PKK43_09390 [Spirochaetota bacterium]|nr:hypothetical protein [Spirochaetota bacterium]
MKIEIYAYAVVIAAAALLTSCGEIQVMKTPDSFARFDREKDFRAASADGVMMKTYEVSGRDVDAKTDEKTWVDEMERTLVSKGYVSLSRKEISVGGTRKGLFREYTVIYNGENYMYSFVLVKKESRLYIAEMGGPEKAYKEKKDLMTGSLNTWVIP